MKFHEIHGNSWNLLEFHEIPWKSQLFGEMEAFTSPWLKTLIFPRDSWWFWRFPGPQNAGNHKNPGFYGKLHEFSDFPLFYIKMLEICDFPHFGVQGASKTTNNPWGLLVVSAMGAKRPPFYQKGGNFMKFNKIRWIQWKLIKFTFFL